MRTVTLSGTSNSGTILSVGTPDSSTGRRSKSTTSTWNSRSQRELTVNQLSGKLGADQRQMRARMTVRYHTRADGTIVPDYVCQNDGIRAAQPICQHIGGAPAATAISELILRALTPLALETAITVSDELIRQA